MLRNDNSAQFSKRKNYKKSKQPIQQELIPKHSKNLKNAKSKKNHKHSKFNHINSDSHFLGPERLTTHVGFFTKGKISNSITRFEKIVPREVRARAHQDLQEVLNLNSETCAGNKYQRHSNVSKNKHHKHNGSISNHPKHDSSWKKYQKCNNSSNSYISDQGHTSQGSSSKNSGFSPQFLNDNKFSSSSWKDKVQQSVRVASANSVLASVHKPQKTSPVKELQLLARKIILTKIHPAVKDANNLLYPTISNKEKLKAKLLQIKNELVPSAVADSQKNTTSSSVTNSSRISPYIHSDNSKKGEFRLNPIYTGEDFNQNGMSTIFPNFNDFLNNTDKLITDEVELPHEMHDFEKVSCPVSPPSTGRGSTVTLVPISPTTSDDSPAWKLELSPPPVKFEPDLNVSPKIYYRHKMF